MSKNVEQRSDGERIAPAREAPCAPARDDHRDGEAALWRLFACLGRNLERDRLFTQSAAVTFFALLSLAPTAWVLTAVLGALGWDARQDLAAQAGALIGPQAHRVVTSIMSAGPPTDSDRMGAVVVGALTLLLSATLSFTHVQEGLNRVWRERRRSRRMLGGWIRKRLVALAMILALGGVVVAASVGSALLESLLGAQALSQGWVRALVLFIVYVPVFGSVYTWVPDAHVPGRYAVLGGLVTGALFSVGQQVLTHVLTASPATTFYRGAGSLVALLLWIYYSSLIFFLGAEIGHTASRFAGTSPRPRATASARPAGMRR